MNSAELLAVIDIIKNEEIYSKRLSTLKQAEQSLKDTRYIVTTVEQANEYREQSVKLKEDAEKFAKDIRTKLDQQKKDDEAAFAKRKTELDKQAVEIDEKVDRNKKQLAELLPKRVELQQMQDKLGDRTKFLHDWEAKIKARESLLASKLTRIAEIVKEVV